jgi:hypothetical protein
MGQSIAGIRDETGPETIALQHLAHGADRWQTRLGEAMRPELPDRLDGGEGVSPVPDVRTGTALGMPSRYFTECGGGLGMFLFPQLVTRESGARAVTDISRS